MATSRWQGLDMFEVERRRQLQKEAPLASRMRPRSFEDFVGQEHLVAPGRVLRRSIEADQVPSMVLWGPPGSGKTTLAEIIAHTTQSHFEPISAVASGVGELRRVVAEAKERRGMHGLRTILFIDEIHRFNKAQQDVILPYVEDGTVTLVGATTENPSFEVIGPLLSRSRVYTLQQLSDQEIAALVERALAHEEVGLAKLRVELDPEAKHGLVRLSNGDARVALTALEMVVLATIPNSEGVRHVMLPAIEEVLQHKVPRYDKEGEEHYNLISAFIKSMRGSDPDASLYWLARMIEAGEDPLFIVRRMVIFAAEDVGLADPQALLMGTACLQAVHFVGLPEGFLPMAQTCVYLATAPKSNAAYKAYLLALEDVRSSREEPVPLHLRNAPYPLMAQSGYHDGYKYAHDYPGHFTEQRNRPEALEGHRYYFPGDLGAEAAIKERLGSWFENKWSGISAPQEEPREGDLGVDK